MIHTPELMTFIQQHSEVFNEILSDLFSEKVSESKVIEIL
jgi:hypothetical protein